MNLELGKITKRLASNDRNEGSGKFSLLPESQSTIGKYDVIMSSVVK